MLDVMFPRHFYTFRKKPNAQGANQDCRNDELMGIRLNFFLFAPELYDIRLVFGVHDVI